MRPLRIGVNALYLIPGGVGGTEIYLRSLLAALARIDSVNRYLVFTNRETGADLVPKAPTFTHKPQHVRATSRPARILWEQAVLPFAAVDVMFNPGFTAPLFFNGPQVTVFHDLQHKRHPEYFRWFDLPFWNFFLYWSAHISRLLLADSQAAAADLFRYYRLPEAKVHVVPLAADAAFFEIARRRKPEPFLLTVATLHPHKNLEGLLRAFAQFRRERPEFRLVVCGMHGFAKEKVHALRDSLELADAVDFPGWIPREDLHDLYARAWAFVFPTLFEGFGIPIVEALAAGVPSACSNIEPVSSIAGSAALKLDPHNPDAIADALRRIVSDDALRARLTQAGPSRAAEFSWERTARATVEAIESVCPSP